VPANAPPLVRMALGTLVPPTWASSPAITATRAAASSIRTTQTQRGVLGDSAGLGVGGLETAFDMWGSAALRGGRCCVVSNMRSSGTPPRMDLMGKSTKDLAGLPRGNGFVAT
jgi:hypothetical protein